MDNNFSQEQKNRIIEMYQNNVDIDNIIKEFSSTEHCIREVLKENSIDRKYNIWSDELYDRLFKLYKEGMKHKDLSYSLLISKDGIGKVLQKKNIERRTYSENNRKYKRNSDYFDNINTPNKAYVLGLIYADGNNYNWGNKHCLTIQLQEEDKYVLERIKDELEYEGNLQFIPNHNKNERFKNCYKLCITDEHISNQLKKLGVVERKSLILKFPTFLRPDLIRHFVRGYFDGDGCLSYIKNQKKWHTTTAGTYEFLSSLSNILDSMFIKHHIIHPKQCLDHNTYVLNTAANMSTYKFMSWLYRDCDIKMPRKYDLYLSLCEKYTNPKGRIKSL